MRFFIDTKLILILFIISFFAIVVLFADILFSLHRKTSYVSNMIWNRDRFAIWMVTIWLFGIFPIWLALILWFFAFFLFKYFLFKKDIAYIHCLVDDQLTNDKVCESFEECISKLFSKTTDHPYISKSDLKKEFSFSDYTNTLICIPFYYFFEIVKLYPEITISYIIGIYLIAISVFMLIARVVYTLLNQKGNFFEQGVYSYFFIFILGILYFVILTLFMKNLGYFTL